MYYKNVRMPTSLATSPISVRLRPENAQFVQHATKSGHSISSIMNEALHLLRREKLRREIQAGFEAEAEENVKMAEEGMLEYWNIVKKS